MVDGGPTAPWFHRAQEGCVRHAPLSLALVDGLVEVRSVRVESAETPHCIALQVATVRYILDEKPAVTCDDAQTPQVR